ncbi:hypothetical protein CW362_09580 [Streptomyces populi]|uniref:Uncharacterized protein n=1 Tax=Streptomyces populi TaxID=2058924 RepID=A0A2I0STD1_9ACTN|nr:hypothetical protein CW362_09580 [Streptomyces populi]
MFEVREVDADCPMPCSVPTGAVFAMVLPGTGMSAAAMRAGPFERHGSDREPGSRRTPRRPTGRRGPVPLLRDGRADRGQSK